MALNQAEFNQLLERIRSNSYPETSLSLRNCNLNDNDAQQLAQALAANTTITTLSLEFNQIGDAGAQALAANTTITTLSLWGNPIGDAGAQALAANTTITNHNLGFNQMGDTGAQALAANTTITNLDLMGNRITGAGAQALALNATITNLNLRGNPIGNKDTIYRALNVNNNARKSLCFAFHLFGTAATQNKEGVLSSIPYLPANFVTIISKYLQDNELEHNENKFRNLEFHRLSIML